MDTKHLTEKLTEEAKTNPASNAVLHMFAIRERARGTVNLNSLYHSMRREGYLYSKAQYRPVLELLATLKVGEPVLNRKNELIGIKNIKIQLQSLGALATGEMGAVKGFKKRPHYQQIAKQPTTQEAAKPVESPVISDTITLEFEVDGKNTPPIRLTIGKNTPTKSLTRLIEKLIS